MSLLARLDRRRGPKPVPHAFYGRAVEMLDPATKWAVACTAEFRAVGDANLRGVLHHDGAFLRFTTWGGVERFVASPIEFSWAEDNGRLHIDFRDRELWMLGMEPLAGYVKNPPAFATTSRSLMDELLDWICSWS